MAQTAMYVPDSYTIQTGETDFTITFSFIADSHIRATVTDTGGGNVELTNGTDFTISGTTLTTVAQQTAGYTLTIWMEMPFTQSTVYKNTGELDMTVIESDLDRAALERQILNEEVARCVKHGLPGNTTDLTDTNIEDYIDTVVDSTIELAMETNIYEGTGVASQLSVTTPDFILAPSINDIMLFIDGEKVITSELTRDDDHTITMTNALSGGEIIELKSSTPNPDAEAQAVASAAAASASATSAAASATAYNVVASLATDVAAVGAAETTLVISNTQTLTANLTIPANVTLDIKHNGNITGAYTLTVNGKIIAGEYQIFGDSLTVVGVPNRKASWFGFLTTATAEDNAAAFEKAVVSDTHTTVYPGDYSVDPVTLLDVFNFSVNASGCDLQFSTGTAGLTLGNSGHTSSVRGGVVRGLGISGSGALTYGMQWLYATDMAFYDLLIDDTTNIGTGLYIDYSWNNNFYNTEIQCQHALKSGTNNANQNSFYGGRFRGNSNTTDEGIEFYGAANTFNGLDISNFKYGIIPTAGKANSYIGCYFEGNGANDMNLSQGPGNSYGCSLIGCYFYGDGTTDAIEHEGNDVDHYGWTIQGCHFTHYVSALKTNLYCKYWHVYGNTYNDCDPHDGLPLNSIAHFEDEFHNTVDKHFFGVDDSHRRYRINASTVSGTVTIDSVENLTDGHPSFVQVEGVARNDTDVTRTFSLRATINNDGTLEGSELTYQLNSGITAIQITDGNLEVTTLSYSNWNIWIEVKKWVD